MHILQHSGRSDHKVTVWLASIEIDKHISSLLLTIPLLYAQMDLLSTKKIAPVGAIFVANLAIIFCYYWMLDLRMHTFFLHSQGSALGLEK